MSKTVVIAPAAEGFTAELASRTASLRLDDLRPEHVARARHCVLDWAGTTVAGSREEAARIACEVALLERESPRATVVGTAHRASARTAALVNGTACHALDYDDSSFWMTGHPSAVVVSAALAVGEARRVSGRDLVAAVVAGHETAARVGIAVGKEHYLAGWHATGTVGTLAAAASSSRALGLDAEATERALGLAATQAAGLKASFGTMAKPLHAGCAAASGVLSALLAEQGFTAGRGAIEGHQGFAVTQAAGFDPRRVDEELDGRLGIEGVLYKRHACCGGTHGAIDALGRARAERPFEAGEVARVELAVSRQMFDICCLPEPAAGIEGKFSLRHVASLVLAGRSTGPSGFTDEAVADPELLRLRERVTVVSSGAATGLETRARVVLGSGEEVVADSGERRPATDAELPREWDALVGKATELAVPVLGGAGAARLVAALSELDRLDDVGELLALFGTAA